MNSFDQETHSQSATTVEEADSAQAAADVPNNAEQSDLARSIHEPRTVPTNACICKLLPMRRHSRCSDLARSISCAHEQHSEPIFAVQTADRA